MRSSRFFRVAANFANIAGQNSRPGNRSTVAPITQAIVETASPAEGKSIAKLGDMIQKVATTLGFEKFDLLSYLAFANNAPGLGSFQQALHNHFIASETEFAKKLLRIAMPIENNDKESSEKREISINEIISAFVPGTLRVKLMDMDESHNRVFDNENAYKAGRWFTPDRITNSDEAIRKLALPNNKATMIVGVLVPKGAYCIVGEVAPQLQHGEHLTGGANQGLVIGRIFYENGQQRIKFDEEHKELTAGLSEPMRP